MSERLGGATGLAYVMPPALLMLMPLVGLTLLPCDAELLEESVLSKDGRCLRRLEQVGAYGDRAAPFL